MKIAVIGIGQSLRGDDAAGLTAIRQWQKKFPETATRPGVHVDASELPGLKLLDMLHGVDEVILVDAVQSAAAPGTIHHLNEEDMQGFTTGSKSAHGWGVTETLQLGRQLGRALPHIRLIGIEAEQMMIGAGLSRTVENAIPSACKAIQEEMKTLLEE